MKKKRRLVPCNMVSPGFEAVYTGKKAAKSNEISKKKKIESCYHADESGNVIEKWSTWTWTKPGEEKDWGEEIKHINKMQEKLGSLDEKIRQIIQFSSADGIQQFVHGNRKPTVAGHQAPNVSADLGFDIRNEVLRVYTYLGEKTPVKEWLAACLWYNLMYNDLYDNPSTWNAGLVRHKESLQVADQAGINLREWMDSVLEKE